MGSSQVKAVVLCAGKGKRLRTEGVDLPKVLRQANGEPLLHYVLQALSFLPREDILLVVGYRREAVLAAYPDYPYAVQEEQLGTGHAVRSAQEALVGFDGQILVCCGDMPLMKRSTYQSLVAAHLRQGNACTILSGVAGRPLPYGRILRDEAGGFSRIVEDKDCTEAEKQVTELNAGVYLFEAGLLWRALADLRPDNAQGEYYLTDAPGWLLAHGEQVGVCPTCSPTEMLGVNTPEQLQQVEDILKGREP